MLLGGPGSVHLVGSEHEIEAVAELGVALLLFSLGLEFSLKRLLKLGARPLLGGALQVVVTLVLATAAALMCGTGFRPAVAFGAMVALSSTAIVLRILEERNELEMPHGRNSLAVLLTQDMAVVPLALLMTILGGQGSAGEMAWDVAKLLGSAAVLIVAFVLLSKLAVLALGTLTLHRNRELTVIFAVVTGLGAAWVAHAAGISPALGAFVAGMLLGSSPFATQIRADVSSLRVLLLTLFFGAAGMVADPLWIAKNILVVAGVSALITAGKLGVIWGIFQALGHPVRVAAATGLCLAQVGEFAFVIGSIGRASGVVSEEMQALVVSVTIVSFILSALLVPASPRFGAAMARLLGESPPPAGEGASETNVPDVVIVGFGPTGQIAARPFIGGKTRVLVLDLNREGVRKAEQLGFHADVGDATQNEVLEHAAVGLSSIVVITIPHFASAMKALANVRRLAPQAQIFVRSRYQAHADDFAGAGAHLVVGDEEQVGQRLAEQLEQWQRVDSDERTADGGGGLPE
jgi:CPA2 family monovalent cation:H+ antiporter-2